MQRVAVFAHYDKKNKIEDYVVYFLKMLRGHVQHIIFVSDSDLQSKELEKINDLVCHSIVGKHGEYDFGSYKRGYVYALENNFLENCEEFILVNDSCYAPIKSFDYMFYKMSNEKQVDFWGATQNIEYGQPHVQSYFMAFKPKVFLSDEFQQFLKSIVKQSSKVDIIKKYEIGLSTMLIAHGYNYDVYSEFSKKKDYAFILNYLELLKEDLPFLKRSIPLYRNQSIGVFPIGIAKHIKKETFYDYKLIKKDKTNNAERLKFRYMWKFLRRSVIRIHFNERRVYWLGKWYEFGELIRK